MTAVIEGATSRVGADDVQLEAVEDQLGRDRFVLSLLAIEQDDRPSAWAARQLSGYPRVAWEA